MFHSNEKKLTFIKVEIIFFYLIEIYFIINLRVFIFHYYTYL